MKRLDILILIVSLLCVIPLAVTGQTLVNGGFETWSNGPSQEPDGWTIRAADNLPSAHFELAVAIDKGKADVLSTFTYIDKVLQKQSN